MCRTAQKTLDLLASGVDRGFDLGGDLGGLRSDPLVDGLEFSVQPVLLRLQLAEFAYEGGVVTGVGDRTGDPRALRLVRFRAVLSFARSSSDEVSAFARSARI